MSLLKKYLIWSSPLLVLLHWLTPIKGHAWDNYCWAEWSKYIFENGIGNVYKFWTDYLPLYHYFLWFYDSFQLSKEAVDANIHYLKVFPLLFHVISGYFVVLLIQKDRRENRPLAKSLFYLLNVAVLYNGLVWGQMDIVLTCFIVISFYAAVQQNTVGALFFFVVAINFKLQAIIFIPPLGLLLLPQLVQQFTWKRLLSWMALPLLFQLAVLLPYYLAGTLERMWEVVLESFKKHESISIDAYNFWHLVFPNLTVEEEDKVKFAGLAYKHWGLLLFCTASFFALLPFFRVLYRSYHNRRVETLSIDKALLVFGLIPLLFFYLNTEMHERYAHPGLIFILIYSIRSARPLPALLASWAYFFNLERVLQYLDLPNYGTLIFEPMFISFIWLLAIVALFLNLYDIGPHLSLKKSSHDPAIHHRSHL